MSRDKIRIGYWEKECRTPLWYPHDSHLILCAPAGSGKGRDLLVPALLSRRSSTVVIDPKGQLAAVVGPYLATIGIRVLLLNPYKIFPNVFGNMTQCGFNPLLTLDPKAPSFGSDCDSLAEAIVFLDGGGDSHWTDSARQIVSGVIMALAALHPRERLNLVNVYKIISGPHFFPLARASVQSGHTMIGGRLGRFVAKDAEKNKELQSIISTAITQCNFMGNDAIAESLTASNDNGPALRFADVRQRPTAVFLILPTRYLATSAKWFRLVIAAAMSDLLQEERGPCSVLAMLDEFAQLGTLRIMSDIMGIGRGYGLQLWPVLQDLNQLRELYPQRWETFLANSGAQMFFAPADKTTADYVSDRAGITSVVQKSRSINETLVGRPGSRDTEHIGMSSGNVWAERKLMYPHEVAQMSGREMLVFGTDLGLIHAGRKPYWEMPECKDKYAPDPYHAKGGK